MTEVAIDTSKLREMARVLKRAEPEIAREFNRALKDAGELVAADARANAPRLREPTTVKVRRSGTTVKVIAIGSGTPAFEHKGEAGTFRHPVYGHKERKWAEQRAHPFLRPAGWANVGRAERMIGDAIDRVFFRMP